jgi:[protein-PII] uridylyltransferase
VYTVDVQSLLAVDRLRALARGELAAHHVSVSRCAAEMPRPLPVMVALLLHGVGEGHPDDPARHGAAIAGPVGTRLGLDAHDVRHMQWLIENQSSMYHWATRRDITDPDVIAEMAREVETVDRLRDLYLFTFASVSTRNPGAMTAWNARMLDDLFHAVSGVIEGRETRSARLERLRRDALDGVKDPGERGAIEAFLEGVPDRYLLANTVAGIRFHASVVARREGALAFGAVDSGVGRGTLEVVIATDDRPGLLADLTAALAAHRFSVDWAQLYTRTRREQPDEAFDLFHVSHPNMDAPDLMEQELVALRRTLDDILAGRVAAASLLAGRARRPSFTREGPRIRTEIHADNDVSRLYTVVDVYTRDRPQLLHAIARTLHEAGLSIALAKVNTEGSRVADVFYVQTPAGEKVKGRAELAALSTALHETIRGLDAAGGV